MALSVMHGVAMLGLGSNAHDFRWPAFADHEGETR
jgi:hypothetical protein